MADVSRQYDDEGSNSQSYSQEDEYFSDEDHRGDEDGSYDSREDGSGSYYSDEDQQDGGGSHYEDEGDQPFYDDEIDEEGEERSQYSGSQGSYYSEGSPRDEEHMQGDEGSASYSSRSGSQSYYDDENGSHSQRSGSQRSHSQYSEDGPYEDDEQDDNRFEGRQPRYDDEPEGSFSGSNYEEDGFDDGGFPEDFVDQRFEGNEADEGSQSGSYYDEGGQDDGQGSYTGSYSDRSRSQSGSYSDSPSRSGSYSDQSRSQSGSYSQGDEESAHNEENRPNRSTSSSSKNLRSLGIDRFGPEASMSTFQSSTPSFAIDSEAGSWSDSHAHSYGTGRSSSQVSKSTQNMVNGRAMSSQQQEPHFEDFAEDDEPNSPPERRLPYHKHMQDKDNLEDSTGSGMSGGESFANESMQQEDDFLPDGNEDFESFVESPQRDASQSPGRVLGGSWSDRTEDETINSGFNPQFSAQSKSPRSKMNGFQKGLADNGFETPFEEDEQRYENEEENAEQAPFSTGRGPFSAGDDDGEEDESHSDDDSFYNRSLISREPDLLPRITEHSVEQSVYSLDEESLSPSRLGDVKSVSSFQSDGKSRASRDNEARAGGSYSESRSVQSGNGSYRKSPGGSARSGPRTVEETGVRRATSLNGYTREQLRAASERKYRASGGDPSAETAEEAPAQEKAESKGRKKKRRPKVNPKSVALLELVAHVNEVMLELEEDGERSDWAEKKETEMDSTARKLLTGFEALVGILLQFSDELELMQTFSRRQDPTAIEAIEMLLGFAPIIDDIFAQLVPVLQHYLVEEVDEEMNDFLYGMNLIIDLLCELSHDVGEKQEWNLRVNTSYATLLELLSRDTLEVCSIFDDVDTPDYEPTETIEDAWAGTGHEEEFKTLQATQDLEVFRQICYDVILSTDQWCPDTKTLMDICGIEDDMLEDPQPVIGDDEKLAEPPEAALQVLEKITGEGLPRSETMARILRRVLPTDGMTDPEIVDQISTLKTSLRVSLGLPSSNLIAISSVPEMLNDPEALGVAGVGKTTLAAMVASHPDVRRFFNDGIAWIHIGRHEMTYRRYIHCLRELVAQLNVPEEEEPLFPELLHIPGESRAKRRRREEGFMLFVRDIMVEFLKFRNVLIILDDICFEPDLDWFDFDPAALLPEDTEEEFTCVILVTTRCRNLLPAADTVEVDMLSESEGVELLIQESGELSSSLMAESAEVRSVVLECANHALAVKSVGRWLNLKHATAGSVNSADDIHEDVIKSMEKILKSGNQEDVDMMYEILNMSLSPAINAIAETLFEALLDLEEDTLLQEGSLFYAQKKEAAVLIPEALSALGVLKGIVTVSETSEEGSQSPKETEEKYVQIMHAIQEEYGEYLAEEDSTLSELTKDADRRWNKAFAQAYLSRDIDWGTDTPDASLDYALEMMPSHLIRGSMLVEASGLLSDSSFVRARLFALGREIGTRRHIKDCEFLFDVLMEQRVAGRKKLDPKGTLRQAYQVLGGLLNMDEDEFIKEEGSPEALEVARAHVEIGFSLAEKRCWEAAISHWETSQELLVSSLGMVEVVASIQLNVGVVYAEMNELEQALGALKQCLRIRGAIHGEEHILYAQTIQKIGDIFLNMSDYHEAMESYNWALDVMHIDPSQHRIDIGDILENMGNIHYSKGETEEALQCYQDALRSKQVDLGEDHPELSSIYHHIGNCLSDQGKTEEAIAHFEEAIRLKEMDPDGDGERDADVLTIEGVLHNLNGRQQEGLESYEKALQVLVTKVPHKKEKVASLLHLIGCVYLMSGEHKKAMKLFEESLQARRKVLGFVHLDVASTLFNMAFLHQTRNRLDKALKCLEEALKIRQLRLPDSEKVAVTHEKIGTLARSIGKTKKAEIAFGEALRIRKLIHGEIHEAVATVLQELGDLMDDLGEYDEAMKYYVEALDIRQTRLGPDDLAVAETLYSMGFCLQNNDASERALQCFEESLSIRKFQLGEDAKEVGDTLNMMGFLRAQRGELDEALALLWDALRIRKLQEDHIKVSETLKNIGNVHREKQEFDLAIECYEECLRIRRAELGDNHEKVADALIAMGNVQSDMECIEDAMHSYEDALRIRTILYGEQDESVAAVLQYMGTLEFRAEQLDRALQLLNEFIRIREEIGAESDGDYVNVLFMVGNIYKMRGNEEEAQRCWTEAYKIFKELGLADGNPKIAEVMDSLVKGVEPEEENVPEASFQDDDMRQKQGKGMFGRFAKGSGKSKSRGQQL